MNGPWRSKALLNAPRIESLRGNAMTLAGDTPLMPGQPVSPVTAAGHLVAAIASVDAELRCPTGPLQLTALDLPQRRLVDGTRQSS